MAQNGDGCHYGSYEMQVSHGRRQRLRVPRELRRLLGAGGSAPRLCDRKGARVLTCPFGAARQACEVQNSSKLKQLLWLEEPTSLAASLAETQLARASISVLPPLDTSHVSEYDPRTDRALHVGDVRPDTLALIMFTSGSTSAANHS